MPRLSPRRLRQAQFPEQKHLEDFNFSFNHSINRQQIFDLATCRFIQQRRGWLVIGQTGVGKTHLIITVGIKAVEAGHRVQYKSAFDLLEDIAESTATGMRRSYIAEMTRIQLLIIEDLGLRRVPQSATTSALLDRFLHSLEVTFIRGKSYRLYERQQREKSTQKQGEEK